jgi:hypothetical protein
VETVFLHHSGLQSQNHYFPAQCASCAEGYGGHFVVPPPVCSLSPSTLNAGDTHLPGWLVVLVLKSAKRHQLGNCGKHWQFLVLCPGCMDIKIDSTFRQWLWCLFAAVRGAQHGQGLSHRPCLGRPACMGEEGHCLPDVLVGGTPWRIPG